ncbi:helix-turn-helix transcriptional regulator [Rhodobacteraceae bacterium NNCM2]|nr:helix-turn-helix transcriptional regulator [Coraliihabitans acroporae]
MNVPFEKPETGLSSDGFLLLVGTRVRENRKRLKLSRRVLSEISGVSERYLAQLEGGNGNISVGLLRRVAKALDLTVSNLVCEDEASLALTELYAKASPDARSRVMAILDPQNPQRLRAKRVALIGLRGAGKSTLGKVAANQVGLPFLELNDEIRAQTGMPLDEIFALYGAEGFRQMEAQALTRIAEQHESLVLGTGGGIVTQRETFEFLLTHFHTIWVKASPEEHMTRVLEQGARQPVEGTHRSMSVLKSILARRETQYSRADKGLDTSGKSVSESARELSAYLSGIIEAKPTAMG